LRIHRSTTARRIVIAAAIFAAVAALWFLRRPRRFDMVATLASIADRGGRLGQPVGPAERKDRKPDRCSALRIGPREALRAETRIARHYLYANAPEGALAILEELQNEVKTWPAGFFGSGESGPRVRVLSGSARSEFARRTTTPIPACFQSTETASTSKGWG